MYLSVSGDAVSQFKRQKKLVSDPLGLTEKVLKIVDTDVWDLPAPGSSGIHTLKWESGGEALIGDAATRQTRYAFRHHMFSDTICFQTPYVFKAASRLLLSHSLGRVTKTKDFVTRPIEE